MKYTHITMTAVAIVLLATMTLAIVNQSNFIANAQDSNAIVIIQPSIGGTTIPTPGTYTYSNNTEITLTAIPDTGYIFQYWIASGNVTPGHTRVTQQPSIIDPETGEIVPPYFSETPSVTPIDSLAFSTNPVTINCGYGYTYSYQAVFAPEAGTTPTPQENEAVVVIQPSIGGTTEPASGTHIYPNGTVITLRAIPDEGYTFQYWSVSGNVTPGHTRVTQRPIIMDPETGEIIPPYFSDIPSVTPIDSLTFTTNPVDINCGYGYTYNYQAVFAPESTTGQSPSPSVTESPSVSPTESPSVTGSPSTTESPSPSMTAASPTGNLIPGIEDWALIAIAVIVIVIIIAVIAVVARRR